MKVDDAKMLRNVIKAYEVVAALAQDTDIAIPTVYKFHIEVAPMDYLSPRVSIFEVDNTPVFKFLAKMRYQE